MARYEANGDFQRDLTNPPVQYYVEKRFYWLRRRSQETARLAFVAFSSLRTRLEYYTPLKKGFILQSKDAHFEKIRRLATRGEINFHFLSSASRGTAWPLHFKFASYVYV